MTDSPAPTKSAPGPVHIDRPSGTHDPILSSTFARFLSAARDNGFPVEGWHLKTLPEAASGPRQLVDAAGHQISGWPLNLGWTDLEASRCLAAFTVALLAKCALDNKAARAKLIEF